MIGPPPAYSQDQQYGSQQYGYPNEKGGYGQTHQPGMGQGYPPQGQQPYPPGPYGAGGPGSEQDRGVRNAFARSICNNH